MPNAPPTRPAWAATTTTKSELLAAFERELRARYAWAADEAKLARFMQAASAMLDADFDAKPWVDTGGEAFRAALRSVGLPERLALHRLQELDDGPGLRPAGAGEPSLDADEGPTCRGMMPPDLC